jgi:hypothetical protein
VKREAYAEALPLAEKAYALSPTNWASIGLLAGILERTGNNRARADALIEKLGDGSAFGAPVGFILYHLVRYQLDRAADWFEKLIAQRDTRAPWIVPHSLGSRLLENARWNQLARMMNLPDSVVDAHSQTRT